MLDKTNQTICICRLNQNVNHFSDPPCNQNIGINEDDDTDKDSDVGNDDGTYGNASDNGNNTIALFVYI